MKKFRITVVIPSDIDVSAKSKEEALRKVLKMTTQQRLMALNGVKDVEITATDIDDVEEV